MFNSSNLECLTRESFQIFEFLIFQYHVKQSCNEIVQFRLMFHENSVISWFFLNQISILCHVFSSFWFNVSKKFLFICVYFVHLSCADSFRCLKWSKQTKIEFWIFKFIIRKSDTRPKIWISGNCSKYFFRLFRNKKIFLQAESRKMEDRMNEILMNSDSWYSMSLDSICIPWLFLRSFEKHRRPSEKHRFEPILSQHFHFESTSLIHTSKLDIV